MFLKRLLSFYVFFLHLFTNDNARKLEQFGPTHRITRYHLTSHYKVSVPSAVIQTRQLAAAKIHFMQYLTLSWMSCHIGQQQLGEELSGMKRCNSTENPLPWFKLLCWRITNTHLYDTLLCGHVLYVCLCVLSKFLGEITGWTDIFRRGVININIHPHAIWMEC